MIGQKTKLKKVQKEEVDERGEEEVVEEAEEDEPSPLNLRDELAAFQDNIKYHGIALTSIEASVIPSMLPLVPSWNFSFGTGLANLTILLLLPQRRGENSEQNHQPN